MKVTKAGLLVVFVIVCSMIIAACSGNAQNSGGSTADNAANKEQGANQESQNSEKTFKMIIGAAISETDWRSQGLMDFKELVEERSDGRIEVELFFGGAIGNDAELIQKTQMNNIQGVITSTSNLSNTIERLMVLDLPFAAPQPAQYNAFYTDGKFGGVLTDTLQADAREKALHLLYLYPFQSRQIATVDKHIKTVEDIKGMNIRTSPSEIERGIVSSFGANPITLGIGDVYTALQTGTIDGEGLPFTDMHAFKHSEVAKKVSFVNFQSMAVIVATSQQFYDSLPEDLQQVVTDAANEVGLDGINKMNEASDAVMAEMESIGVEFHHNTPEELDTFRAASQGVIDQFKDKLGEDWINTVFDELNKHLQ